MLKAHNNLMEPRPSDRLRVGERIVDVVLRDVTPVDGGEPVRITLKSLDVLMVLVAYAGKVVSREALLEWVWPDTLPTDDVVTQAITQLRRALGDDRGKPRHIETIAKRGYRLLAPIEWLPDAPSTQTISLQTIAKQAQVEPINSRSRWATAAAIAVAVAVVVAAVLWIRRPATTNHAVASTPASNEAQPVPFPFQRITSLPADEAWPSPSPDGTLVAYVRYSSDKNSASLMLQATSALPPRQVTETVAGRMDLLPAWSPDGSEVAFVRVDADHCAVMSLTAAGGDPREIARCPDDRIHPLAWYPDSKALLIGGVSDAQRSGGGDIRRLDLASGSWTPLRYVRSDGDMDVSPSVSPDGRWIAFQRNISLGDLWRMPVTGGTPQRLTSLRTNIYGLDWMPDGRTVVFGKYDDGTIVLSRLDVRTRRITAYAIDESATYPRVAARTGAIAFVIRASRSVMERVRVPEKGAPSSQSEELFPTTATNLLPSIAPDGRQLAFVSDRTGDSRLWWADLGRPDSLRSIEGFVPVPRHASVWSADSSRLLAIGRIDNRNGVYEIQPRSGRVQRLPAPDADPVHALYGNAPDRLYVIADHGAGRLALTLYDIRTRPWRVRAVLDDVALALNDPARRRIVFTRVSSFGLWAADPELRKIASLGTRPPPWLSNALSIDADGVRFLAPSKECPLRWMPLPSGDAQNESCLGRRDRMIDGVSYDATRRMLYFSADEGSGGDIGWIPADAANHPASPMGRRQ